MFAYGSSTLVLALFLSALGFSDTRIGLFMTLTLIGDVCISLALTFVADALGRRMILILGSVLMVLSGVVFALSSNYWVLLFAAVFGVISPSGNEIGPFRAIEESTLAQLTDPKTRSDIFAFYVIVGTLGSASGFLLSGWVTQSLQAQGWSEVASFRSMFWLYAFIGLIKTGITSLLSRRCEAEPTPPSRRSEDAEESQGFLARHSTSAPPPKKKTTSMSQIPRNFWSTLAKLCTLFFVDSFGSGMVPNSLVVLFMYNKFQIPEGSLGSILAAASFASSLGNVFASSIAKRIGLVKTMVFTHLPSAIFLALVPAPSSLILTVALLVARASLASMDQAPRSAFLSAIVPSESRTAVMGIVNTVKTAGQSSGPLITGVLAENERFWIAFVIAGSLKAGYDLWMLRMFASTKLDGDRGGATDRATSEDAHVANDQDIDNRELQDLNTVRSAPSK